MNTQHKRPQPPESVNGWPDPTTLWAMEDDGRRRDRILTRHGLMMKVVDRKALNAFRCDVDDKCGDLDFHLTSGLGYDLERLEAEIEVVFGVRISSCLKHDGMNALHDATLEALGDARCAIRPNVSRAQRRAPCRKLARKAELLYDRIESQFDDRFLREFIEDALQRSKKWLETHDDTPGRVQAQIQRLIQARHRSMHPR